MLDAINDFMTLMMIRKRLRKAGRGLGGPGTYGVLKAEVQQVAFGSISP